MLAQPITFPYPSNKSCAVNIDFNGNEYQLVWNGDWTKLPDLTQFPRVDGAFVTPIQHTSIVHELWTKSQVMKYGADSHIRVLESCTDEFPICKVATDNRQRRLLQDEFLIIRYLASNAAPVVRTHPDPLVDDQGIFGFRMERLFDMDITTATNFIQEIEMAIDSIHQSGVVHGDISPSNLMLNHQSAVTVIDFGRAGYTSQGIPPWKRVQSTDNNSFSLDLDKNALNNIVDIFNRKGCFN